MISEMKFQEDIGNVKIACITFESHSKQQCRGNQCLHMKLWVESQGIWTREDEFDGIVDEGLRESTTNMLSSIHASKDPFSLVCLFVCVCVSFLYVVRSLESVLMCSNYYYFKIFFNNIKKKMPEGYNLNLVARVGCLEGTSSSRAPWTKLWVCVDMHHLCVEFLHRMHH